jgi:hypothetical protein
MMECGARNVPIYIVKNRNKMPDSIYPLSYKCPYCSASHTGSAWEKPKSYRGLKIAFQCTCISCGKWFIIEVETPMLDKIEDNMRHSSYDEEFKVLRDKIYLEIAVALGISVPTLKRWVSGETAPHRFVVPGVIRKLEGLYKCRTQ